MPPGNAPKARFIIAALVLHLLIPVFGSAQTAPCTLSSSALPPAPELKGFFLGMTMEQAKSHATNSFGRTDLLGHKKTINPAFDPRTDKSQFQDVRSISLNSSTVVSIRFGSVMTPVSMEQCCQLRGDIKIAGTSGCLDRLAVTEQGLTCKDFQLTVSMIAQSPSFRLVDT